MVKHQAEIQGHGQGSKRMTRYETFKNLSVRELAELIEEHVTTELGFCKGNCEPCKRDEVDCQHPGGVLHEVA